MFRQRHELHVREAFLLHVGNQLVGKLTVVVHVLAPAGGVHLIDADRSVMRVAGRAFGHPIGIIPFMGGFDHDGSGARRNLVGALHRIGLHGPFVIGVEDFILVDFAGLNAGMNSSQMPEEPSSRMAWVRPFQPLKSPTTRTACAFGAHTVNAVPTTCSPSTPSEEPIGSS